MFESLHKEFILNLYIEVIKKLFRIKNTYFSIYNTTEIIDKLSTDINSIGFLIDGNIMKCFGYVFQSACGVVGLLMINWKMALIVLVIIPIKILGVCFFSKRKELSVEEWLKVQNNFYSWFADTLSGIRELKLWGLSKNKIDNLEMFERRVLELEKNNNMLEVYNSVADSVLQWIITSFIYAVGGYCICTNLFTIGGLTAFLSYCNYVFLPITFLFNLKIFYSQIKPSINRINTFYSEDVEMTIKPELTVDTFSKAIVLENISFSYKEQSVFEDINLKIYKGDKIAIIGENGTGKTTLLNLLLRFIDTQKGSIYLDNININKYNIEEYRDLFSVVSQDIYLFQDTIINNILMGRKYDINELYELCHELKIDNFVSKLPKGYDSFLDKNGDNLSGGERQKIALIRAVIKDSPILILDEATSNIDIEYDKFFHSYILNKFKDKTIIIITHKEENLLGMDKIYKIENHKLLSIPTVIR